MSGWVWLCALAAAASASLALGEGRRSGWRSGRMTRKAGWARKALSRAEGLFSAWGGPLDGAEDVPELLDLLTLGLTAGLSFDAALELAQRHLTGPLAQGLVEAQALWQVGAASRPEALGQLADRWDDRGLRRFTAAVGESLEFGVPLAATLQRQAQALRDERRDQAEEAIEKAPVRMLGPLAAFVVPAMLLVIVGPLLAGTLSAGGLA